MTETHPPTPEATPEEFASRMHELARSVERLGAGIAAIGELMQAETDDWTHTHTLHGIGYIMEAVGDVLTNRSLEALDIMGKMGLIATGGRHG